MAAASKSPAAKSRAAKAAPDKASSPGGWRGLLFGFERRHHQLLPWPAFRRRLALNVAIGLVITLVSLAIGLAGYWGFEGFGFVQSFLNASMILSGMGPVEPLATVGGKIFAGIYALYSGLAVLAVAGLVLAPVIHRLLHHFHAADDKESSE